MADSWRSLILVLRFAICNFGWFTLCMRAQRLLFRKRNKKHLYEDENNSFDARQRHGRAPVNSNNRKPNHSRLIRINVARQCRCGATKQSNTATDRTTGSRRGRKCSARWFRRTGRPARHRACQLSKSRGVAKYFSHATYFGVQFQHEPKRLSNERKQLWRNSFQHGFSK